jgi:uncharacterized damage-inducible protein DinB
MIDSNLEVLGQARSYLAECGSHCYVRIIAPYFMSSAGTHMRHILDHYRALMSGISKGAVDYNVRDRDGAIERDPAAAMAELDTVEAWLQGMDQGNLDQPLQLSTEVSVSHCSVAVVSTTLGRELVFVASHAIHHYAMIQQIALHQDHHLDAAFGMAPATASHHRREQAKAHG